VNSQNVRVFNWRELLEDWDNSLTMNPRVQTVVDNLRAACNPDCPQDLPLSHFLTYLNDEPEALKWFLYECVAMRWMWGEVRLDYVGELMNRVDLDSTFPVFPGSTGNQRTIRQFLEDHLTPEEKRVVDLMPPLVRAGSAGQGARNYLPAHRRLVVELNADENQQFASRVRYAPAEVQVDEDDDSDSEDSDDSDSDSDDRAGGAGDRLVGVADEDDSTEADGPQPREALPPFLVRLIREGSPKKAYQDDVIAIRPTKDPELFHVRYRDLQDKISREVYLPLQGLRRYMSTVLRSANRDEDGFRCVQVDPPAAPSVLFRTTSLTSEIRDIIYDHLELALDFWPRSTIA
jgi:hypothetical protein